MKPWHMVARVTCSLCLSLIFRPSEQTCPTQRDTCTAPPAPRFGKTPFIHRVRAARPPHFASGRLVPILSGPKFIPTNDVLSGELLFLCVCVVCCLSSADKRLAGPLPSDLHPSTVLQLQPGEPDFQVSHPHVLDCCPLTCANIKEREREKQRAGEGEGEREREGGKE